MNITFRILSKVQAAYCQELLDSIPAKRLEIIQAAMIDHITDKPRGRQPTASKTIARIDTETKQFITETHKIVGGLGSKKSYHYVNDIEKAMDCIRQEYADYCILRKSGSEYTLSPALNPIK
jgi:transketolase C-terminal domain/subunit